MIFVPTILDDLEQRLSALEAILPLQRSADEHDAAAAMLACMHEMRRLMDRLPEAQARYQEALTEDSRQEAGDERARTRRSPAAHCCARRPA